MVPTALDTHDFRITIGAGPGSNCMQPYSASVLNISAMSFGALSASAILALNGGARQGRFAHDTGEGSISQHHREQGGDLIWTIGQSYLRCRHADGTFDAEKYVENANQPQVRMSSSSSARAPIPAVLSNDVRACSRAPHSNEK